MAAIYAIRLIIWIYNIVSLPVFLLLDWPFRRWLKLTSVQNRRVSDNRWTPALDSAADPFKQFETAAQFFQSIGPRFGTKRCIGYRKVLQVDGTKGPVVKKRLADEYTWLTYQEFDLKVRHLMRGFSLHGMKPRDRILLALETRPEWLMTAVSVMRMGVTLCTVYSTSGVDGIVHAINETACTHVVANQKICRNILSVRNQVPGLQTIVLVEDQLIPASFTESEKAGVQVVTMSQVEKAGMSLSGSSGDSKSSDDSGYDIINANTQILNRNNGHVLMNGNSGHTHNHLNMDMESYEVLPEDLAIIMYTSGTTGVPKGVMFTHKSLIHALTVVHSLYNSSSGHRIQLTHDMSDMTTVCHYGYLPSAHIFELCMEMFMISLGARIGFGSPLTAFPTSPGLLSGSRGDAEVLNPTFTIMVPLVGERIKQSICEEVSKKSPLVQQLFHFGIGYKNFWNGIGFSTPLTDAILFKKTRLVFGSNIRTIVVGGAAIAESTHQFLRSALSSTLVQGYGTTETFALTCVQSYFATNSDCGQLHSGCEMMLEDWEEGGYRTSDQPNPRGELVVGGKHMSQGYFKREEETNDSFFVDPEDPDIRWFRTGDIVEVDQKVGTIRIIDRKKDLVKLMNGEFVALGQLESLFKNCTYTSNLMVHASSSFRRIIVIAVPDEAALIKLADQLNLDQDVRHDVPALCRDPRILQTVEQDIQSIATRNNLSRAETPAKVLLVPDSWTPENGLTTASLKNRRKQLVEKYASLIQQTHATIV